MYRSLAAAALVPLALGDFSYDYNVPTMAPTTEVSEAPTTVGTFGACPIIQAVGAGSDQCPADFLACPPDCLKRCDEPGLRAGDLCYVFVPNEDRRRLAVVEVGDVPPGAPFCPEEEIIEEPCVYFPDGPPTRRRLQGGQFVVQVVVADATGAPTVTEAPTRTETYAPTRMTEAPSYAPTTDTYAPTMAPTATGVPTFTDAPTGAPTNATTEAPTPSIVRRRALLEKGSSFIDESVWFQRALAADKSGVVQSLRDIWGY